MPELGEPGDQVEIKVEEDTSQNEDDVIQEENPEVPDQELEVPDGTEEENWQEQAKEEEIEVETVDEDEPGAMPHQSGWVRIRSSDLYHYLKDRDMKRWLQFKTWKRFIQMHTCHQIGIKSCII